MQHNLVTNIHIDNKKVSKDVLFNVLIVDKNNKDHSFLRTSINAVVPQVIIESIYNAGEALRYFTECKSAPHLIFLNNEMLNVWGRNLVEFIKGSKLLSNVPLIFLINTFSESQKLELLKQGADNLYSRPYEPTDLLRIVGHVNGKWLA
ncbi:MAG: response regulator [Bacteroidia bacterium]|nr:response regulator [Bacteroidia bacterium]